MLRHIAMEKMDCPRCGALAGSPCRLVQREHVGAGPAPAGLPPGRVLRKPHAERMNEARKAGY